MSAETIIPTWMRRQITIAEYDSWSGEQCAGIEIVDGMVVVGPSDSKRHNRRARLLANALDPATGSYRTGAMFTGIVEVAVPFPVQIDLGRI